MRTERLRRVRREEDIQPILGSFAEGGTADEDEDEDLMQSRKPEERRSNARWSRVPSSWFMRPVTHRVK